MSSPAPQHAPPLDWPLAAAVAAVALGLLAVLCWPVPVAPREAVVGPGTGDFASIAWGLWEAAQHFPAPPPTWHEGVLYPTGARLLLATPLESWLLSPVTALLGPVFSFNLLQVGHLVLAAVVAALLARDLGASRAGAALAAVTFAASPVLLTSIHNGNADVSPFFTVPLAGLLAGRCTRSWAWALAAGLGIGLAPWLNPYAGVMAAACAVLLVARPRTSVEGGRLLLAAGLALTLALAFVLVVQGSLDSGDNMVFKGASRPPGDGAASLDGFLLPGRGERPDPWTRHAWYLGWVPLLLAGAALVRRARGRWRLLGLGLVGLVLSLGAVLSWAGAPVQLGGQLVHLPGAWLQDQPVFRQLRIVYRYGALVSLAVGLAASLAPAPRRLLRLAAPLALLELLTLGGGLELLTGSRLPPQPACALLAELDPGPVVHLPASHQDEWLLAQTCHGRPVAQGIKRPMAHPVREAVDRPGPRAFRALSDLGFRYLVLTTEAAWRGQPLDPEDREDLGEYVALARALHLVVAEADGVLVVELGAP